GGGAPAPRGIARTGGGAAHSTGAVAGARRAGPGPLPRRPVVRTGTAAGRATPPPAGRRRWRCGALPDAGPARPLRRRPHLDRDARQPARAAAARPERVGVARPGAAAAGGL